MEGLSGFIKKDTEHKCKLNFTVANTTGNQGVLC